MDKKQQATSFGREAEEYERSRPTYPPEAADWLVPPTAKTVLDLAAGTGKFTRSLVDRGVEVIAVEPDPDMLSRLNAALPSVREVEGTAESIPLPDDSVDVVTVAQAWHWVDPVAAPAEIARVLRPGGTLGILWNLRDERTDWVRRLDEIVPRSNAQKAFEAGVELPAPFGATERFTVDWDREVTPELVLGVVASGSDVFLASQAEQDVIFAAVRELLATHPETAGKAVFTLPYRTFCFRASLPGE